jgi:hypothetical protein
MDQQPSLWDLIFAGIQALMAVATGFLAWVQLRHQRRETQDRQRAAYASLYAESYRLSAWAQIWDKADLVAWVRSGLLRAEDIVPRDWGVVVQLLGQVGSGPAVVGSQAYQQLDAVLFRWRTLKNAIEAGAPDAVLRQEEEKLRTSMHEAALCFRDAMNSAPLYLLHHTFDIRDPESRAAKDMSAHILRQGGKIIDEKKPE